MNFLNNIYEKLPISLQHVATSIYGYYLIKQRYGKHYLRKLNELRSRNEKVFDYNKYQLDELNRFLQYAKRNSPYYQEKLINISLPLKSIEELKEIPVTTKEDIRANIDNIVTIDKSKSIKVYTGGTTGKSLSVFYTIENMQERMAILDYFKEQHGFYKGMKRASFTGKVLIPMQQKKKVFWRYNYPLKQLLFSSFHLTDENIPYYIKALNKFKPMALDGFPSVMVRIAEFALKNDIKFTFKPIAIFPTAETINDYDREVLEKAFSCKVRNQYASSEGAPFITECKEGNLHLNIDTGVFEKLDPTADISEVLVTSFTTYGTPLIRYKIGDVLEFTDEKCSCGIITPIIKRIIGRNTDFLYSRERGKIHAVNLANSVKYLPRSVKQVQFVQDKIDEINVKLVIDENLYTNAHTEEIRKELLNRLGPNMKINFEFVDEIPVEKSGKTRFIKNSLKI